MIKLGIENIDNYLSLFKNKRVALVTNHTGVNQEFKTTIEILKEKVNLVALFAPEHGVRGDLQDGLKLDNYFDETTQLPVYSLYGKTRKPTKEMLKDIDLIAFDIQDVGARFYTYIYTMAFTMMAAAEEKLDYIVFDRPNPLGGEEIEGNILNLNYRSFVGYYPLLERYGLTIGELALLFNKEYQINANLTVIPLVGYKRKMNYFDTKLAWVLPSPNLPTIESSFVYLATCYLEGTNVSEGRGTTKPFSLFGAPWLDNLKLIETLKSFKFKGVKYREAYFTPTFSKYQNQLCRGVELIVDDYKNFEPVYLGMAILKTIAEMHQEFRFKTPVHKDGLAMINLLVGDNFIKDNTLNLEEIKTKFNKDKKEFLKLKRKYHIYE